MTDPNMPWSLKGISDEARDFAKAAAEESDIAVGAWISAVIRAAAQQGESQISAPPSPEPASPPPPEAANDDSGSTIERAVQIVSDFGFEPEGPAHDTDLVEDPELLQIMLDDLERQLTESGERTDTTLSPLIQEIERIRGRLDALRGN